MPADWWDAPSVISCPLTTSPQAARTARRLTRSTLRDWGLTSLADDAEMIIGEFVANAVTHAASYDGGEIPGLRLMRRSGEVMCAVLDPSDDAPVLREATCTDETGRGLRMVDSISDIWGWSPVVGRGKAVWAILFFA